MRGYAAVVTGILAMFGTVDFLWFHSEMDILEILFVSMFSFFLAAVVFMAVTEKR